MMLLSRLMTIPTECIYLVQVALQMRQIDLNEGLEPSLDLHTSGEQTLEEICA
jgi:hypothetical protein